MKPSHFPQCNIKLRAPRNAKLFKPEIEPLHAAATYNEIVSLWRPSWRERLSILFFGKVWLHVLGNQHPPVSITGAKEYFKKPNITPFSDIKNQMSKQK